MSVVSSSGAWCCHSSSGVLRGTWAIRSSHLHPTPLGWDGLGWWRRRDAQFFWFVLRLCLSVHCLICLGIAFVEGLFFLVVFMFGLFYVETNPLGCSTLFVLACATLEKHQNVAARCETEPYDTNTFVKPHVADDDKSTYAMVCINTTKKTYRTIEHTHFGLEFQAKFILLWLQDIYCASPISGTSYTVLLQSGSNHPRAAPAAVFNFSCPFALISWKQFFV